MKGKTISFVKSFDFKGLFKHIYRKHIINSLGVPLFSFIARSITRFLSPASRKTITSGLFNHFKDSDITDHLALLFCEVMKSDPELVVELGTRGGESTKVLLKASSITGARMLSVDIDDCKEAANYLEYSILWHFVQSDDLMFASEFNDWCTKNGYPVSVDVLFIDTSHEYEHTKKEIQCWFPLLSENGKVIFHDTNMGNYTRRKNGSIMKGWDNNRGVIRAIEEFFGQSYNEKLPFIDWRSGWLIEHYPHSNGLTVMSRLRNE